MSNSCSNYIDENLHLKKADLKIIMNNELNNAVYHHIFLENIDIKDKSLHQYYYDFKDYLELSVSYGSYNLYYFGLSYKNETSMNVINYSYIKNIKVNKDLNLSMKIEKFEPQYSLNIEDNIITIMIDVKDVSDFFALSSVSIKQGSDRYRSSEFEYNESMKNYITSVQKQYFGDWYMNLSFYMKYKFEKSILMNENIKLSTSYYPDNFLKTFLE